jgi:hypothetical protein
MCTATGRGLVLVYSEGEDCAAGESDERAPRHRFREALGCQVIDEEHHRGRTEPFEGGNRNGQRRAPDPSPRTRGDQQSVNTKHAT